MDLWVEFDKKPFPLEAELSDRSRFGAALSQNVMTNRLVSLGRKPLLRQSLMKTVSSVIQQTFLRPALRGRWLGGALVVAGH